VFLSIGVFNNLSMNEFIYIYMLMKWMFIFTACLYLGYLYLIARNRVGEKINR